jgi:hypothetical protein
LRRLTLTVVSVLRYVDGTWPLDEHRAKQLGYDFDNLLHLHGCAQLGQSRPFSPTVRVYRSRAELHTIDLQKIRSDLAAHYANVDCMFALRIVVVEGPAVTDAFLLPWPTVRNGIPLGHLEPYRVPLPEDVNPEHY